MIRAGSSRRTATPISGAASNIPTWIVAARRESAASRSAGPQKIWDSTLAAAGLLSAKHQGDTVLRRYHDITFERFWKRELDIEDPSVIEAVLIEAGADAAGLADYLAGEGPREVARISRAAEETGIFGVPSFVLDGEQFWGSEHLPDIREMLGNNVQS